MGKIYEFKNILNLIDYAWVYGDYMPKEFVFENEVFKLEKEEKGDFEIAYLFVSEKSIIDYVITTSTISLKKFEYIKNTGEKYTLDDVIATDSNVGIDTVEKIYKEIRSLKNE